MQGQPDKMIDCASIAKSFGIKLAKLLRMSERGDYPDILRVSRGCYRVNEAAHERWLEQNMLRRRATIAKLVQARIKSRLRGYSV